MHSLQTGVETGVNSLQTEFECKLVGQIKAHSILFHSTLFIPPSPQADVQPQTHINDGAQFVPVHVAVRILVVHLEGPAEFVLEVSSENQVQSCYELQEVNRVVLKQKKVY